MEEKPKKQYEENEKAKLKRGVFKLGEKESYSIEHRSIVALKFFRGNESIGYASGVLLSKNIILTGAHNLYNQTYGDNSGLKVYLSVDGLVEKEYQVQKWKFAKQFYKCPIEDMLRFDYALVKLATPVSYTSFPKLTPPCEDCLMPNNKEVCLKIFGFPNSRGNYQEEKKGRVRLQQHGIAQKNKILGIRQDKFKIAYSIPSISGLSGCPIIIEEKIIGINYGIADQYNLPIIKEESKQLEKTSQQFHVGRIVTLDFLNNIKQWCQQLKGDSFEIDNCNLCSHLLGKYSKFHNQSPLQQKWKQLSFISQNLNLQSSRMKVKNLFQLNLSSDKEFKLVEKDMVLLAKIQLPLLASLDLQNNRIQDGGLSYLCRNDFQSLKRICLDDNAITINGLKYILFSKWKEHVQYNLYSVYSNGNGYHLNVGQYLPMMKRTLESKDMSQVDFLIPVEKCKTLNALNLLLATPLNDEKPEEISKHSSDLEQAYKKQRQQNPISLATVMLELKALLGNSLQFSKQSDVKSRLTSKILFTGLLNERVRFQRKIKKHEDFHFSDFKDNHLKLKQFEEWYFGDLRTSKEIDASDMTIDEISEGCIRVVASDSLANAYTVNQNFLFDDSPQINSYFFTTLRLTEDEFDPKGNYAFPQIDKAEKQKRGGFPYYQPVLGRRFGIKVKDLYGSNNWLLMDGNKEEWTVAFHGVNLPTSGNKIRSIMNGREEGNMLRAGIHQAHKNDNCLRTNQACGQGIYVSPYFQTCLLQYSSITRGQRYHIVLQCRSKPSAVRIASRKDYWVINDRQDLRPYGIILFTDSQMTRLRQLNGISGNNIQKNIYGVQFTADTWRNQYSQIYTTFHSR